MSAALHELNTRFGLADRLRFDIGEGGLVRACIETPACRAALYLHGAHLTHWQPAGAQPVLFTSRQSHYAPDKPIRGGMPVIFPWFGPHPTQSDAPMHGLARTWAWQIEGAERVGDAVRIVLMLQLGGKGVSPNDTRAHWPHDCTLRLRISAGAALEVALDVTNDGDAAMTFEEALHTYFAVDDVRQVEVAGLSGTDYIDKVDRMQRKRSSADPTMIEAETDRVYLDTTATCIIDDPVLQRRIRIDKSGSRSTVLWNPWIDKAARMSDFGDDEWQRMLCIETANAMTNRVTTAPGQTHRMSMRIACT